MDTSIVGLSVNLAQSLQVSPNSQDNQLPDSTCGIAEAQQRVRYWYCSKAWRVLCSLCGRLQECKVSSRCPPAQRASRLLFSRRQTCRHPHSISLRRSFSCPAPLRAVPLSSHTLQQPGAPLILVSPEADSINNTSVAPAASALRVEAPAGSVRQVNASCWAQGSLC